MPELDTWGKRLLALASLSGIFAAFLYWIGRTYLNTYFATIGVQVGVLRFEWNDYVFAGAHWIGILLAVGFTALAYCLFIVIRDLYQYLRTEVTPSTKSTKPMQPNSADKLIPKEQRSQGVNQLIQDPNKLSPPKHPEPNPHWLKRIWLFLRGKDNVDLLFNLYFFIVSGAGIVGIGIIELGHPVWNIGAAAVVLSLLIFYVYSTICGLRWKKINDSIKTSVSVRYIVLISSFFILLLFPYLASVTWGATIGSWDSESNRLDKVFPSITLTAEKPLTEDLQWGNTSEGLVQTEEKAYLIIENNDQLFIRPLAHGNETLVIPTKELSSYKLNFHSAWEWVETKP